MFEPIDLGEFEKRTGIGRSAVPSWNEADRVVSLRDLTAIVGVQAMSLEYLEKLMTSVALTGDPDARPYKGCRISRYRIDPRMSKVGQTFIERRKILALHDQFDRFFEGFDVPSGISKKGALIVFGRTADGEVAVAHYLPPIVEQWGNYHLVLDGIHRFSFVQAAGTTIEIVKITEPKVPFPCDPRKWGDIAKVDEKPPKEKRFFGLKPHLFRDLKRIGIDG